MENGPGSQGLGDKALEVGASYEFTHGPASAPHRTMLGVLEEFDSRSNTYTFRLDDGTQISLVDHEVDAARRVEG